MSNLHGPDNMTTNAIKSADGCNDCAILDPARAQPASAPEFLDQLIDRAERAGASDIHLQMAGPVAQIAFRLDGVITSVSELPEDIAERVIGRIKFLARLRTYQESLPQDGRIDKAEVRAQNDIRVATYPTVTGEKVVLRLFDRSVDYAVWSAVELVLNQRLIRRLCGSCAGRGCSECFGTGYHGRVPLVEWLRVDETMRRKLRAAGPDAVEPQRTQQAAASELLQRGLSDERERSRIFTHEMG